MNDPKKQIILTIFFAFLVLSISGFVRSEMLTSSANVSYDSAILEQFNNNSELVRVIVDPKNISELDTLVSILSNDTPNFEGVDKWPSSPRIDAKITQQGFDELINDTRIADIYFDAPVSASNPVSCGNGNCNNEQNCTETSCFSNVGVEYEKRILNEFDKLQGTNETFVEVIFYLKNTSQINDVLSDFSSNEIKDVINKEISDIISAKITEAGFYKLIQDSRVDRVYFSRKGYFLENNNWLWIVVIVGVAVLMLAGIFFYLKRKKKIKIT